MQGSRTTGPSIPREKRREKWTKGRKNSWRLRGDGERENLVLRGIKMAQALWEII